MSYLTQGLQRAVQRHPDKIALCHVAPGDERSWTFAQFADQVGRRAAALRAHGIAHGDRVAILSPNSDAMVITLTACWWLGAVACPMNVRWSVPELQHAVADCGAALAVVDAGFDEAATGLAHLATVIPAVQLAAQGQALTPVEDTRCGGDALAAILYTGGTTGRSKGVMLSHANFWSASMTRGAELNNSPDSVSLLVAPLFHVAGLGRLVGQSIVGGCCITLPSFAPTWCWRPSNATASPTSSWCPRCCRRCSKRRASRQRACRA